VVSTLSGSSLASVAMRCSFVETVVGLGVPAIFPSNASKVPGLPSLRRVAWGDFPDFTGTMESSDVSNPSRRPPVSLGRWYLRWVMGFAPPIGSPHPLVAVVHGLRWTGPIAHAGDGRLSQVPTLLVNSTLSPANRGHFSEMYYSL
jgi:hypothetical protein